MNNNSITLQINGKPVVIKKLPLRKVAEVFKALDKLPSKFTGIDFGNISNEKLLEMLPGIIGDFLPEVAKLISIASPIPEKEVQDELGLAEAIEILTAIYEVNDFTKVVENVKKLVARKPEVNQSKTNIGSTEPLTS